MKAVLTLIRHAEMETWLDWALLPWWALRWAFAWCWWKAWSFVRWLQGCWVPYMYGRYDDPAPIVCERCLWAGPRRWAVHAYHDDGTAEDVEPVDECPRCGAEV